jgi:hypothetical protein
LGLGLKINTYRVHLRHVVIWYEFGKDLSYNLKNHLIVFPPRRIESVKASIGGKKNEGKTGVYVGFGQNGG